MVEFAINNAEYASTGLTAFYINCGRHLRVPALVGLERSMDLRKVSDDNDLTNSDDTSGTEVADTTVLTTLALHCHHSSWSPRRSTRNAHARRHEGGTIEPNRDHRAWVACACGNEGDTFRDHHLDQLDADQQSRDDGRGLCAAPPANFDPNLEPQSNDTAVVNEFLDRHLSVVRYVRDAIAMGIDRQKENADRRGRKKMVKFTVGDRGLLSTVGIQPTLVTNLGANKLVPRFIDPFKVLKVLGDAYTLQLPTVLRLYPNFYVGRLRRYYHVTTPSDDPAVPRTDTASLHGAPDSRALALPDNAPPDPETARSRRPRWPAPLVDSHGNIRHVVDVIIQHNDTRAGPRSGRRDCGARHRDDAVPGLIQYLLRWLDPMPDSWGPREILLADVPDRVAAYEASLGERASPPDGAAWRRA
ncbi:hypothetical protein PHMEG_00017535 [Phytophthora megakarya]|uniref:Tf2-1-like SH3-like domain-containing protein n=1 Tax=Phytophthora megakarya TaxID=4795 RepID=A0A225VWM1_9STRA|nr:hypothetical protein PHMEG_00017535 [Phytophthora megakarya]